MHAFDYKINKLEKISNNVYDEFFLFDLIKFIGNKYAYGNYSDI